MVSVGSVDPLKLSKSTYSLTSEERRWWRWETGLELVSLRLHSSPPIFVLYGRGRGGWRKVGSGPFLVPFLYSRGNLTFICDFRSGLQKYDCPWVPQNSKRFYGSSLTFHDGSTSLPKNFRQSTDVGWLKSDRLLRDCNNVYAQHLLNSFVNRRPSTLILVHTRMVAFYSQWL